MPEFRQCSDDELVEAIDRLHDVVCAAQRRLPAAAAEYDRRGAWSQDGARSMGAWLAYWLGVAHRTGAERARAGATLDGLPVLAGLRGWLVVAGPGGAADETGKRPGLVCRRCACTARQRARPPPG